MEEAAVQVDLGEDGGHGELREEVLDVGKRLRVFDGEFIEPPVVDSDSYATVLLDHQERRRGPRRVAWLYEASVELLLYQPPELLFCSERHFA